MSVCPFSRKPCTQVHSHLESLLLSEVVLLQCFFDPIHNKTVLEGPLVGHLLIFVVAACQVTSGRISGCSLWNLGPWLPIIFQGCLLCGLFFRFLFQGILLDSLWCPSCLFQGCCWLFQAILIQAQGGLQTLVHRLWCLVLAHCSHPRLLPQPWWWLLRGGQLFWEAIGINRDITGCLLPSSWSFFQGLACGLLFFKVSVLLPAWLFLLGLSFFKEAFFKGLPFLSFSKTCQDQSSSAQPFSRFPWAPGTPCQSGWRPHWAQMGTLQVSSHGATDPLNLEEFKFGTSVMSFIKAFLAAWGWISADGSRSTNLDQRQCLVQGFAIDSWVPAQNFIAFQVNHHFLMFRKHLIYRGWYLGRTVGSRFCSCKVALPAQPQSLHFPCTGQKKITTKVQPQPG